MSRLGKQCNSEKRRETCFSNLPVRNSEEVKSSINILNEKLCCSVENVWVTHSRRPTVMVYIIWFFTDWYLKMQLPGWLTNQYNIYYVYIIYIICIILIHIYFKLKPKSLSGDTQFMFLWFNWHQTSCHKQALFHSSFHLTMKLLVIPVLFCGILHSSSCIKHTPDFPSMAQNHTWMAYVAPYCLSTLVCLSTFSHSSSSSSCVWDLTKQKVTKFSGRKDVIAPHFTEMETRKSGREPCLKLRLVLLSLLLSVLLLGFPDSPLKLAGSASFELSAPLQLLLPNDLGVLWYRPHPWL